MSTQQVPADDHSDCLPVTHLYVPLGDALALPEGYVVELRSDSSRYEHESWLTEVHTGSLPAGCLAECQLILRFWTDRARDVDILGDTYGVAARSTGSEPLPQEFLERTLSVVEIVSARPVSGEGDLAQLLEEGLRALRRWQRALHHSSRSVLQISTWEQLPPQLLMGTGRLCSGTYEVPDAIGVWLQDRHPKSLAAPLAIDSATLARLEHRLDAGEHTAFSAFGELRREAIVSLRRGGDHRVTVVMAAAASERLLEEVYTHLRWESNHAPEDVAASLIATRDILPRVGSWFSPLLGGSWDVSKNARLRAWRDDVARLRNRVVHAGYEPDRSEAGAAIKSLNGLVAFVADRLSTPGNCARFPLTALALVGDDLLDERGRMTRRTRKALDDASERDLHAHARRFTAAVRRKVELNTGWPAARNPSVAQSWLFAIIDDAQLVDWCIHDRGSFSAQRVPKPNLAPELEESLNRVCAAAFDVFGPGRHAVMVETEHSGDDKGIWVDEHHLMPGTEISGP